MPKWVGNVPGNGPLISDYGNKISLLIYTRVTNSALIEHGKKPDLEQKIHIFMYVIFYFGLIKQQQTTILL